MALYDDVPLPPELAGNDEDERFLEGVVAMALVAADDAGADPEEVGAELADADVEVTARHLYPDAEAERHRWRIETDDQAEWAMRHVAAADRQLAELRQRADEWTARITDWFRQASREALATKGFMEAHLERYALERRDADPRARSLVLPSGRVSTRRSGPKAVIIDANAVLRWAEENAADAVTVERKVLVSDLRKLVTVVQIPTRVLVGPCGHDVETAQEQNMPTPTAMADTLAVGSAIVCPECGEEGLVGRWIAAREYVEGPDGRVVPGVAVADEEVTATVQAEKP